jgi:hypothetical protein
MLMKKPKNCSGTMLISDACNKCISVSVVVPYFYKGNAKE